MAMVPVAQDSLLVKGTRLFFRLTEDLAPFMFEVPRAFGSHDALLRRQATEPDVSGLHSAWRILDQHYLKPIFGGAAVRGEREDEGDDD